MTKLSHQSFKRIWAQKPQNRLKHFYSQFSILLQESYQNVRNKSCAFSVSEICSLKNPETKKPDNNISEGVRFTFKKMELNQEFDSLRSVIKLLSRKKNHVFLTQYNFHSIPSCRSRCNFMGYSRILRSKSLGFFGEENSQQVGLILRDFNWKNTALLKKFQPSGRDGIAGQYCRYLPSKKVFPRNALKKVKQGCSSKDELTEIKQRCPCLSWFSSMSSDIQSKMPRIQEYFFKDRLGIW